MIIVKKRTLSSNLFVKSSGAHWFAIKIEIFFEEKKKKTCPSIYLNGVEESGKHTFSDTKLGLSWAKHQNIDSVCMGEKSGVRKLAA